jgi:hypothetical protein
VGPEGDAAGVTAENIIKFDESRTTHVTCVVKSIAHRQLRLK